MPSGYGKGRATGYSDYYKSNDRTPGDSPEEEEETPQFSISMTFGRKQKEKEKEDRKKSAIRRRLQNMKKAGN